jgi:hypothetical protein
MLQSKGACTEGMAWVRANLPEGAEYQEFLDRLAKEDRADWASWLLASFGATTEIKTVINVAEGTKHIFATGTLVLKCAISLIGRVQAGGGINAGRGIEAGGGIKAGFSVTCELEISSGLRIFAGLCMWRIPTSDEFKISCKKVISGTVAFGTLEEKK